MTELSGKRARVHLVAICGVGMAALAGILQSRGWCVTGSDQDVYPPMSTYLQSLGIQVFNGYDAENLKDGPDLVVIGNAISRNNPEAQRVFESGIPYLSLPQALGKFLIADKKSLVIAGTHGKTTTTALMAWVLSVAGWDPGFFVGGIPLNFGTGCKQGEGPWVVLEGDEYDSAFFDKGPKFLHYRPDKLVLTSLEFDHADIYPSLDHIKAASAQLVAIVPRGGVLLACNEYEAVKEVVRSSSARVIFYGAGEPREWEAREIEIHERRTSFRPYYKGKPEEVVAVSLLGRHNLANALAVYAMGKELSLAPAHLREGLATFAGVRRRLEYLGEAAGVAVIEDFAHHPTAVRETIAAVRAAFPGRRLWAIFEPRSQTSRRQIFESEFARALAQADRVIVAPVYQPERIPVQIRLSPERVVEEINGFRGEGRAEFIQETGAIPPYVVKSAQAHDLIVVMSNGGFDSVPAKILRGLEQRKERA